jgi:hypothetical protein
MKTTNTATKMTLGLLLASLIVLSAPVQADVQQTPSTDPILVVPDQACPWIELLWDSPYVVLHPECMTPDQGP